MRGVDHATALESDVHHTSLPATGRSRSRPVARGRAALCAARISGAGGGGEGDGAYAAKRKIPTEPAICPGRAKALGHGALRTARRLSATTPWRPLRRFNCTGLPEPSYNPPVHHSTPPPLHPSTTPPLHHSTTPPLHHSTTPPLQDVPAEPNHAERLVTSSDLARVAPCFPLVGFVH